MSVQTGKWVLISDPTDPAFDAYLVATGVSDAHREAGAMVKPTVELSRDGDTWTFQTLSELKNTSTSFVLGIEFTETTADDRVITSVYTESQNKLIHSFTLGESKAQTVWEQTADGMVAYHSAKGVTAVRKYKKVG